MLKANQEPPVVGVSRNSERARRDRPLMETSEA